MGNTFSAIMAQRSRDTGYALDLFPTPPWATRALVRVLCEKLDYHISDDTILEPASGRGHMASTLREYGARVISQDIHDYGCQDRVTDFLDKSVPYSVRPNWVITNPPFSMAEAFIFRALTIAKVGVAMLVRTNFLEGIGRHERLFKTHPPASVHQFTGRVPMEGGCCAPDTSTATAYCWVIWIKGVKDTRLDWIPNWRKELERPGDYDCPALISTVRAVKDDRKKRKRKNYSDKNKQY